MFATNVHVSLVANQREEDAKRFYEVHTTTSPPLSRKEGRDIVPGEEMLRAIKWDIIIKMSSEYIYFRIKFTKTEPKTEPKTENEISTSQADGELTVSIGCEFVNRKQRSTSLNPFSTISAQKWHT